MAREDVMGLARRRHNRVTKLLVVAMAARVAAAGAAGPVLSADDEQFLRSQARNMVDAARLAAGQTSGPYRNETGYDVRVPGGNMGYPAFWVRDAVMMLGGDLVGADEVEGWIRLMASTIRGPGDWQVRPDVVVPAYAVPDHINFDGRPTFYPGSLDTGDRQGGRPWGKYPPLDDHFYFIHAVHAHWRCSKESRLFRAPVRTSFNELALSELCEQVYRVAPIEPASGLCVVKDAENENAKDWGFCDAESKSGRVLFPSILRLIAARDLAELFSGTGDRARAARYEADAALLRTSIPGTFLRPGPAADEAWLHSATGIGNQADVWGSAYAVWSGAVEGMAADRVSRALVRAFRERTAVREGCVRQLLTTDPLNKGGWQISVNPVGEYQNGGYWGTPAGWYIAAMHRTDATAAAQMAREYVIFLRSHRRPDGRSEAWEWFNPDTKRSANPLYVATVVLPYLSLGQAGLLQAGR
jgi:hypothetical protein